MKRIAIGIGLVAAVALLVWSLDPFGRLVGPAAHPGATPQAPTAEAAGAAGDTSPAAVAPQSAQAANPPDERRAVDAATAAGPAVFRLLEDDGAPVRGARVLLARDGELLHDEVSDEQGRVSLPADGEAALLVARSGRRPIELWTVRLEAGAHELRCPARARVAGRAELEGGAPAVGLRLRLWADAPMLPEEPLPEVLWKTLGIEPAQAVVLAGESGADGGFDWAGLQPDWSGALRLPRGWRIRSASHGQIEPAATSLRLEGPAQGLVLQLAAPATLRGRLVSRRDATALAGVALSARLRAPEPGSGSNIGTNADGEGRFELVASGERIIGLELRLGRDPREGRLLLALDAASLPPDGELGDVLVDDVRDVPFVLRTATGDPIRAGTARAAGMSSEPTDTDGRGLLRWVPLATPRLRAEATGFVPAEVELAPLLPDPLVIVLEPACALSVKLIPPAGGDPEQFRVVLRREEGVTAGPCRDQADQQAYVEAWSFAPVELMQAPHATFLAARPTGPDGVSEFRALRIGVPIELEVRGITGLAVYHRRILEPLRAGERRRLEIALDGAVEVFRGRVLDAAGNPLVRATVQLDGQILGWTDASGAFLCFLADRSPGTLVLQHETASTLFLHDYAVPPGGRAVEFRLQPARAVAIEVVDADGRPVPQAEVWILQEGFTTNTQRVAANRHVASALTLEPFEIEVRVGGRRYVQPHTSDVPEARVVVPVHGSVAARVPEASTRERSGRMQLVLQPSEGAPGDPLVAEARCEPGGLTLELAAVLPGRYEARLNYTPTDAERALGAAELDSLPLLVTVEAARRAEIVLELN